MTLVDTSIVVAAFASWHEHHSAADRVVDGKTRVVAAQTYERIGATFRLIG